MTDNICRYKSNKTGRTYNIKRHYTCQSDYVIYLVGCKLCPAQYVGQTTKTMSFRHQRHRTEIKTSADGIGEHFYNHAKTLGLNVKATSDFEELMENLTLVIIASVDPTSKNAQQNLDRLEKDFQHRLMTMNIHGGMNRRDETKRNKKNK